MNHFRFFLILSGLSLRIAITGELNAQTVPTVRYTTSEGLVQRQVMSLFEDSKGFLWIGTKGGVSRFDGYQFRNFTVADGLISNFIMDFEEKDDGTVWAFGKNGVSVIRVGDTISNKYFPGNVLFVDAALDESGAIWILVNSDEQKILWREDGLNFKAVSADSSVTGNIIRIHADEYTKRVLVEAEKGYFEVREDQLFKVDDIDQYPYLSSDFWSLPESVTDYPDLMKHSRQRDFFPLAESDSITVCRSEGSVFWASRSDHSKGLFFADTLGGIHRIMNGDLYISLMMFDSYDQLWIGTEGGLMKIPTMSVRNYFNPGLLADVWTIREDRSGRIWFGNYGTGLAFMDKEVVSKADKNWFPPDGSISGRAKTLIYPQGIIGFDHDLFMNSGNGVLRWNGQHFSLVRGIPPKPVYASLYDSVAGCMLFSVFNQGIYELFPDGRGNQMISRPGPAFEYIWSMVRDEGDRLWLGASDTLAIFDHGRLLSMKEAGIDFTHGAKAMARDSSGWLWIANDYGLFSGKIISSESAAFLPVIEEPVNALQLLPDGRLAIGTPNGIGLINLSDWNLEMSCDIIWLDTENGYQGGACKDNGLSLDSKGRLWVACEKGAVSINYDDVQSNSKNKEVRLEQVWVLYKEQDWQQVLTKIGQVRIPADQNAIRFEFTYPDLCNAGRIKFHNRLLPNETHWNDWSTDREVTYRFLDPGKYHLEIEANGEGIMDTGKFEFIVLPKWYETLVFRISTGILAIFIIAGLTWWLTRLRQKRKQAAADRKKQLEDLRFRAVANQLSPHFTQNVLSAIGSLVLEEKPMEAYQNITRFSRMLRSLMATQERFFITLQEELDFVKNYLDLEVLRFSGKLNFVIDTDSDVAMGTLVPRMILQIPAENAVKHGLFHKSGGGTVTITISNGSPGQLLLFVRDDGVGRVLAGESGMESNGRGLMIIREILEYLNQSEGAANQLRITDLFEGDQPTGTVVEIILGRADK